MSHRMTPSVGHRAIQSSLLLLLYLYEGFPELQRSKHHRTVLLSYMNSKLYIDCNLKL